MTFPWNKIPCESVCCSLLLPSCYLLLSVRSWSVSPSAFSLRIYTWIWHLSLILDSLVLLCHSSWVVSNSTLTTVTFSLSQSPDFLSESWCPSLPAFFIFNTPFCLISPFTLSRSWKREPWQLPHLWKVKLVQLETKMANYLSPQSLIKTRNVNDERCRRGLTVPRGPFSELSVTPVTLSTSSLSVFSLNFSVIGRVKLLSISAIPRDGWWKHLLWITIRKRLWM